jgi:crossover junction endodeoxyribonuclease RuvC
MPLLITKNLYVGIDPGQSGGMAILSQSGTPLYVTKMPQTERDIWEWLRELAFPSSDSKPYAMIEQVHSMPGQGVTSTFKFGMSYGGLRMALIGCGIPFETVTPQKWQKALGVLPRDKGRELEFALDPSRPSLGVTKRRVGEESQTDFKGRLKAKAQQLFPSQKVTLATADALLLAEYCRRTRQNGGG